VITKCSLFQNNPSLTAVPYRIHSSVTRSIFRDVVSELEGNPVKITSSHLRVSRFFASFESSERGEIGSAFIRLSASHLRDSFEFVVKGSVIELDFAEAVVLFPAAREQLSVDGCTRKH
jgi:hypothetical protein